MEKCVFAGSFDPFTNGHLSIVETASLIFEEVVILVSVNSSKKRHFNEEEMVLAIKKTLKKNGLSNCKVLYYEGLIAKYCEDNNIKFMVRGLRNSMDFEYETNITLINKEINPNIKTIYFPTDNAAISSSMVRELLNANLQVDFAKYVPEDVKEIIKKD